MTLIIYVGQLFNLLAKPAFIHLQARGIFTAYWVINTKAELVDALFSSAQGFMTDKPNYVKPLFIKKSASPLDGKDDDYLND